MAKPAFLRPYKLELTPEETAHLRQYNSVFIKNSIKFEDFGSHSIIDKDDYYLLTLYEKAVKEGKRAGDFWQFKEQVDWKSTDKSYWKSIIKQVLDIEWLIPYRSPDFQNKTDFIKHIKQFRYQKRVEMQNEWYYMDPKKKYGAAIGSWLWSQITINDSCMDNFRFAKYNDLKDRKRYYRAKNKGCCGFFDGEAVCPYDLNKYLFGCNYGH